MFVESMDTQKH